MRERAGLRPLLVVFAVLSLVATAIASNATGSSSRSQNTAPASLAGTPAAPFSTGTRMAPGGGWVPAAAYPRTNVRYALADLGEMLYVIGGVSDGTRIPDVNRYNASTNAWAPLAPIPVA